MLQGPSPLLPRDGQQLQREHGLDWLRVFAFGLLILYHSGMAYVSWPWTVKDTQHSQALEMVMLFFNRWRLPLIFLIAGAGVAFSLRRRSLGQFAGERLRRLALPFALMIRGDWRAAALEWERLGCPFEQAAALSEGDLPAQLHALAIFEQLGATPAAGDLRKHLHKHGIKGIPSESRPPKRYDSTVLTTRELEVLRLIAEGLSNPSMAKRLTISVGTVKAHTASIYSKLGVNNRVQALSRARELLLI